MRTPITAADEMNHPPAAQEGPPCYHNEPTVLRNLNGRNVYVCARYPQHHCRACCPVDVMLLSDPEPLSPEVQGIHAEPFGSPFLGSPMDANQTDPISSNFDMNGNDAQQFASGSTPSRHHQGTPRMPSAPSKQASSITSRAFNSRSAARSLTPIFNGFSAAASRASQLGGRFVTLSPTAASIAKLQRQLPFSREVSPSLGRALPPSHPISIPMASRKRLREVSCHPAALAAPSVRTASRGKEPSRAAAWVRSSEQADTMN